MLITFFLIAVFGWISYSSATGNQNWFTSETASTDEYFPGQIQAVGSDATETGSVYMDWLVFPREDLIYQKDIF